MPHPSRCGATLSAGFALLQRFLRETSGLCLERDKLYLVEDRLRGLLQRRGIANLDDLARMVHANPCSDLATAVAETLTINETSFFRDRTLFSAVSERLLPQLLETRRDKRRLRIWCAGCSTGQEPYSLAMVIDDMTRQLSGWQVEILATDLSRPVLDFARAGIYSQFEVQRGLPVTMLLRHFSRLGDGWRISDYLRAKVTFRTQNLLYIPRDFGPFDVVFCRNVLFYFDAATKRRVISGLVGALAPEGFIVLGGAERVGSVCADLLTEGNTPFVFRRTVAAFERHAVA